jgi:hypothetical protein
LFQIALSEGIFIEIIRIVAGSLASGADAGTLYAPPPQQR